MNIYILIRKDDERSHIVKVAKRFSSMLRALAPEYAKDFRWEFDSEPEAPVISRRVQKLSNGIRTGVVYEIHKYEVEE